MDAQVFYQVVAPLCFTLLGFWWAVVQFRHAEWMSDPDRRRMAYLGSLNFLLPGTLSLLSVLGGDEPALWRIGFTAGGVVGVLAVAVAILAHEKRGMTSLALRLPQVALLPLYALVAIIAIQPEIPKAVGIPVSGLEAEGLVVSALIFAGVNLSWALFAEPRPRQS